MNQKLSVLANTFIISFTWMDDDKVFVKYFKGGIELTTMAFENLSSKDKISIDSEVRAFFEKSENAHLILWSY